MIFLIRAIDLIRGKNEVLAAESADNARYG
jgi:hypothetical protein